MNILLAVMTCISLGGGITQCNETNDKTYEHEREIVCIALSNGVIICEERKQS